MKIRRDKRDILFSNLVRERAEWTCERCHKQFPEGHRNGLECSHFFTRSRKSVRWHPLNAAAHCTGCHTLLGGNPMEFADWIRDHLGRQRSAVLRACSGQLVRFKRHDLDDIHANLKASWAHMQARRAAGECGRLEFDDPLPEHFGAVQRGEAA